MKMFYKDLFKSVNIFVAGFLEVCQRGIIWIYLSISEFCSKLAFTWPFVEKNINCALVIGMTRNGERELKVCSVGWRGLYMTGSLPGLIQQLTKSWKLA